jgi:hypothetical protein
MLEGIKGNPSVWSDGDHLTVDHGPRRELCAGGRDFSEAVGKPVAAPGPKHTAAIPVGRKATVAVKFGFVRPSASIRQLAADFGIHGFDEAGHKPPCSEFFREHGNKKD